MVKPDAWLIRETRGKRTSILCGHMFKRREAADVVAERMSNHWRTCVAVPVVIIEGAE